MCFIFTVVVCIALTYGLEIIFVKIKDLYSLIFDGITEIIRVLKDLINNINAMGAYIIETIKAIGVYIIETIKGAIWELASMLLKFRNRIMEGFEAIKKAILDAITGMFNKVINTIGLVKESIDNIIDKIKNQITSLMTGTKKAVEDFLTIKKKEIYDSEVKEGLEWLNKGPKRSAGRHLMAQNYEETCARRMGKRWRSSSTAWRRPSMTPEQWNNIVDAPSKSTPEAKDLKLVPAQKEVQATTNQNVIQKTDIAAQISIVDASSKSTSGANDLGLVPAQKEMQATTSGNQDVLQKTDIAAHTSVTGLIVRGRGRRTNSPLRTTIPHKAGIKTFPKTDKN
jgi:hypothetical protein